MEKCTYLNIYSPPECTYVLSARNGLAEVIKSGAYTWADTYVNILTTKQYGLLFLLGLTIPLQIFVKFYLNKQVLVKVVRLYLNSR